MVGRGPESVLFEQPALGFWVGMYESTYVSAQRGVFGQTEVFGQVLGDPATRQSTKGAVGRDDFVVTASRAKRSLAHTL